MTGTTVGAATAAAAAPEKTAAVGAPLGNHLPLLRTAGTWTGITDNLDLLQDMGMTAVSSGTSSKQTTRTAQLTVHAAVQTRSRPALCISYVQVWITPIPYQFRGKTFGESAYHGALLDTWCPAQLTPTTLSIMTCSMYHDMQLEQAATSIQP